MKPEPPPLPCERKRRRWRWRGFLALLGAGGVAALWFFVLRVDLRFVDDAGKVPDELEVRLSSGNSTRTVLVHGGRLRLLRWRWSEVEITDLTYVRGEHPLRGRRMDLTVERNTIRRLRDAARGQPSVPQRGDPDPRNDR